MKQYVIDQLRESDYEQMLDYLNENAEPTALEGIYWVPLPYNLYNDTQRQHAQCQHYYFAVNLDRNRISFEWLIRSRQTLRCSCIGYATPKQRDYIIQYGDSILERFNIKL